MTYSLPVFALLQQGNGTESDISRRLVIVHIPTGTIIEAIMPDQFGDLPFTPYTYEFNFSIAGIEQKMVLFPHTPITLSISILDDLLAKCAEWFQRYFNSVTESVDKQNKIKDN